MTTKSTILHKHSGRTVEVIRDGSVEDAWEWWNKGGSCDCEKTPLFEFTDIGVCMDTGSYVITKVEATQ